MDAVQTQSKARMDGLMHGLSDYSNESIECERLDYDVIWQKGCAQLLDFGGEIDAPALLCIPSLINKYYILDLYPERSLVRYFLSKGYRVLVMDWGDPSPAEQSFNCADYVEHYALEALDALTQAHEGEIHLLGYCMGGVFALAMAQLKPLDIAGLILLATPWDFDNAYDGVSSIPKAHLKDYETLLTSQKWVPPLWVQSMFHAINPLHFQEKFQRFPTMSDEERYHFVAVESWVNDGVPLSPKVAKNCLIDWPHNNQLYQHQWSIRRWKIMPEKLRLPTLIIAPTQDRIVPLSSSKPLVELIENATLLTPTCGHVSMVVGKRAKRECWLPVHKWLKMQN